MAGRHRRTPAWRRVLLRLRRSDRAARTAALQAEVVALRATVRTLRAELDAVLAATALERAAHASRLELELPLVRAALAPAEVATTRTAAAAAPALAGVTSIALDLHPDTATTEIVLADLPATVRSELPESAMLDPKQARDADVSDPGSAAPADTILPERRTA